MEKVISGFNKVIGIGLPKTATSSLAAALTNNNIPTVHFGSTECEEIRDKMYRGIYKFDTLERYKGITNAFEMIFPQVAKVYPNSKFIYTVRSKDSWMHSVSKHWERMMNNEKASPMLIHQHLITFGTYLYNEDRFSYVYDMHSDMVSNYFRYKLKEVLKIDITTDSGYINKVCDFLGIALVNNTLVYINKGV